MRKLSVLALVMVASCLFNPQPDPPGASTDDGKTGGSGGKADGTPTGSTGTGFRSVRGRRRHLGDVDRRDVERERDERRRRREQHERDEQLERGEQLERYEQLERDWRRGRRGLDEQRQQLEQREQRERDWRRGRRALEHLGAAPAASSGVRAGSRGGAQGRRVVWSSMLPTRSARRPSATRRRREISRAMLSTRSA